MAQLKPYTPLGRVQVRGQRAPELRAFLERLVARIPEGAALGARVTSTNQVALVADAGAPGHPFAGVEACSHVILNLEDVELVRRSAELRQPVLWFSSQDARRQLGPLAETCHGAWWDAIRESWLLQDERVLERVPGPRPAPAEETRFAASAAIAALHALGLAPEAIARAVSEELAGAARNETGSDRSHPQKEESACLNARSL